MKCINMVDIRKSISNNIVNAIDCLVRNNKLYYSVSNRVVDILYSFGAVIVVADNAFDIMLGELVIRKEDL